MTQTFGQGYEATTLAAGHAEGVVLVLDAPLSFWGGFDATTGRITDQHHPQVGVVLTRRVLVMPGGRGSSSSSSVLAEAIRAETAPAAIVLREADPIIALGAIVAAELYGRQMPVVAVDARLYQGLHSGQRIAIVATAAETARISLLGASTAR